MLTAEEARAKIIAEKKAAEEKAAADVKTAAQSVEEKRTADARRAVDIMEGERRREEDEAKKAELEYQNASLKQMIKAAEKKKKKEADEASSFVASPSSSSSLSLPSSLEKMTVKELKEVCRERGLKVGGNKGEIIERIRKEEGGRR